MYATTLTKTKAKLNQSCVNFFFFKPSDRFRCELSIWIRNRQSKMNQDPQHFNEPMLSRPYSSYLG